MADAPNSAAWVGAAAMAVGLGSADALGSAATAVDPDPADALGSAAMAVDPDLAVDPGLAMVGGRPAASRAARLDLQGDWAGLGR